MTLAEAMPLLRRCATMAEVVKRLEETATKQPADQASNVVSLSEARRRKNVERG